MGISAIKASGGDYTTIQAWHDASRSAGDVGECYNEAYAEDVSFSKDSLILRAASGEKHTGTVGTGARVAPSGGSGHTFTVTGSPFDIYDMEVKSGNSTSNESFRLNDSGGTGVLNLERCLLPMGAQGSNQGDCFYTDVAWTINIENCFAFGHNRNIFNFSHSTAPTSTVNAKHLTGYGIGRQFLDLNNGTLNVTMEGCLLHNDGSHAVLENGGGSWGTQVLNDCILSDASGTGESFTMTNVTESATFTTSTASSAVILTNLTLGSEDLHLVDHANNIAQDHVNSARLTVTDDIDDDARPGAAANDAGADEVVSAGVKNATSAMTVPMVTMAATATVTRKATSAQTVPMPTMASTAEKTRKATSAMTIPMPIMAGSATTTSPTKEATSAMVVPFPTMSATAEITRKATSAMVIPFPTMAGSATATSPVKEATSAMVVPFPTMSATAEITRKATSAMVIPFPTMTGSATATSPTNEATSAMVVPFPIMAATAEITRKATGALVVPFPTMAATAEVVGVKAATSAMTVPFPVMAGTAEVTRKAIGTLEIPFPTMTGTAARTKEGTSAMVVPFPVMSASATINAEVLEATSAMTVMMPVISASGVVTVMAIPFEKAITMQGNDIRAVRVLYFDVDWRVKKDGDNLIFQRLESGVWVTKDTISA